MALGCCELPRGLEGRMLLNCSKIYSSRKQRKRMFRGLWIQRINAAARERGISYSRLIAGLKKENIEIDRLVLADLAHNEREAFDALAERAKAALAA